MNGDKKRKRNKAIRRSNSPTDTCVYNDGVTHTYNDTCLSHIVFKKRKLITKKKYNMDNIDTIDDLIKLCDFYSDHTIDDHVYDYYQHRINFKMLYSLKPCLIELSQMIGLNEIKKSVTKKIKYYLNGQCSDSELMHTVIYGQPGCGKTTLAKIIAKIYTGLGYLQESKVTEANATDLIAKYVGQTAHATQSVVESALGGVLIIDEVYSLGGNTAFSKECIDMLTQCLDKYKDQLICIVIGYKDDVDKYFFSLNKGLQRRFPIRYTVQDYTSQDMLNIFIKRSTELLYLTPDINCKFFEDNKKSFPFFGGDIEIFIRCCINAHGNRIFLKNPNKKYKLTATDVKNGFSMYKTEREIETKEDIPNFYS